MRSKWENHEIKVGKQKSPMPYEVKASRFLKNVVKLIKLIKVLYAPLFIYISGLLFHSKGGRSAPVRNFFIIAICFLVLWWLMIFLIVPSCKEPPIGFVDSDYYLKFF
jgi:surface polysaccharide O-acyltransferase-like enzyme